MDNDRKINRTINMILWIVQIVLAICLIWASSMKLFSPADKLG